MSPDLEPTQEAPASSPPKPQHGIFFGRFGFRAGWGIAIFLVVITILTVIGGFFAIAATGHLKEVINAQAQAKAHPNLPRPHLTIDFSPTFVLVSDGILFFGMFAYCWLVSRAERRPLASYGIGKGRVADFIPGAIWGVVSMSCLVAILRLLHLLVFDGRALHGAAILGWGAAWLLAFLIVGFCEEYEFRGYIQYTLMRGVWGLGERLSPTNPQTASFWIAAIIMSLTFGGLHMLNGGENLFGISQVFCIGMVFSYALWRTGSLWWGIGFHGLWDWSQSFLFGVPDSGSVSVGRLFITHPTGKPLLSGGTDGPEGSLFAVIFVLLTLVVIRLTTHPGTQPSPQQLPSPGALPPETQTAIA
jgi:membrane protease YdiL (CAAX protease family)